jgi:hypothetical protein
MNKTQEFINHAFSLPTNWGLKYPCNRCRNALCEDKRTLTLYLCMFGFIPDYEVWTHHDESVGQKTASVVEEEDRRGDDRMDEMLDAIRPELETNSDGPPTLDVQKFFDILRALEEPLHEYMIVSILAFVSCLMAVK